MNDDDDLTSQEVDALFGKLRGTNPSEPLDILIVDDVHANIYVMESILTDTYRVKSVYSAQDMWKLMETTIPRLLLLDLMMPFENGFQVLEKIRGQDRFSALQVIVVSAKDSKEDVIKAFSLGAVDYIVKPITEDVLVGKIEKILGPRDEHV